MPDGRRGLRADLDARRAADPFCARQSRLLSRLDPRRAVRRLAILAADRPDLHYLTGAEPFELVARLGLLSATMAGPTPGWATTALVGDDERLYADRGIGPPEQARDRWPVLKALGDEAAAEVAEFLPAALEHYRDIYVATHLPPLCEACWHEGSTVSDDEWAPHFTCKALGDVLLATMRAHPTAR